MVTKTLMQLILVHLEEEVLMEMVEMVLEVVCLSQSDSNV